MKRKKIAIILALAASAAMITTACGSSTDTASSTTEAENVGSGEKPDGEPPQGGEGFGGGANTQTFDYDGTYSGTLTADGEEVSSDSETIESTDSDVNSLLSENGGTLTVTGATVNKSGDDSDGDSCNFYGVNSIALAVNEGSTLYLSDSTLNATSEGSNAIFATDSASVFANSLTIKTSADNSRGLDATYSGTIIASDMDISTQGDHCATCATDRGGGNISISDSTLSTAGSGSPLLYSTGDIEATNVTGTSTGSQIAGMEGLNTIMIKDSTLTSEQQTATASDPVANGVIIYQSTSGDADTSTGESALFQAVDSTLTSAITEGSFFYITNTTANVLLSNTTLSFDDEAANLLQIEGNDSNNWGTAGKNGATVNFTALGETLSGDISVDTISSLNLYLLDGTTYTGAMTITENATNTNATDEPIIVNIDTDSTWIVTEDTTISALNAEDTSSIVDENGKSVTIIANGETIVKGDSSITVTVEGEYSDSVSTSEINEVSDESIDTSEFDAYFKE